MGSSSSKASSYDPNSLGLKNKYYNDDYIAALPSLKGKVVAVTGASSTIGLGFICAKTLAKKGARVILLNRTSERAMAAEQALKEQVPDAEVSTIGCDLSSFESVNSAIVEIKSQLADTGLDILCNNAGVMALQDKATVDGYDIQMQTNHLSHFLLCRELYPLLEKASELRGEARIVHHSSGARHMVSSLRPQYLGRNGGNLGGDSASMLLGGARWVRYGQTKLANAVFSLALRDKLAARGSKVKALCAAPGLAASQLQKTTDTDGGMGSGTWFMGFGQTAEDGAMSLINCCAQPGLQNGDCLEPNGLGRMSGPPAPFYPDKESQCSAAASRVMIWEESEKALGKWEL